MSRTILSKSIRTFELPRSRPKLAAKLPLPRQPPLFRPKLQNASVPLWKSNRGRSIILIGHISWFLSIQGR